MQCGEADCKAEAITRGRSAAPRCLLHASEAIRDKFIASAADSGTGLRTALRHLDIDAELFEEFRPVLPRAEELIDFTGATFKDGIDFGEMLLQHQIRFNGATFDGDVRFAGVTFKRPARFNGAVFRGLAIFGSSAPYYSFGKFRDQPEGAVFDESVEFIGAQFLGDARFDRVKFGGDLSFQRTHFRSKLYQEDCPSSDIEPGRTINLMRARFGGGAMIDLPPAQVLAWEMEIGAASRMVIRGPLFLDRVTLNHPLSVITVGRGKVGNLRDSDSEPELSSLVGATLQAPLIVGNGVSLGRCQMSGANGLERLSLQAGARALREFEGRRVLYDEVLMREGAWRRGEGPLMDPNAIAQRYRQLRQGLEEARNAPGAADFYYGEMEMRRYGSVSHYEQVFLWLYWLVSGYGLRAWRSTVSYVLVLLGTSALFHLHADKFLESESKWWDTLMFVARLSVSFFPNPDVAGVTNAGQAVLLALRFVSPALIALTVLAIRARVHR